MIGFDFDDTIANLSLLMEEKLLSDYNMKLNVTNRKFYYCTYPGVTDEEMGEMVRTIINKYTRYMEPEFGELLTLQKVFKYTKKPIIIITNRGEQEADKAREWLRFMTDAYAPFEFEVFSSRNIPKIEFIKEFKLQYFVDDKLETAKEIIQDENYNIERVYIKDKSWNRQPFLPSKIIRIYKLSDIFATIKFW